LRFTGLIESFSIVKDPRMERTRRHNLIDIIVTSICGCISGAEGWVEIEEFGNQRLDWLKTILELPNGIPSHDTFARVFSLLDPKHFESAFRQWLNGLVTASSGEVIALDGKCLNGTQTLTPQRKAPFRMVSAWATKAGVILGQSKAGGKGAGELEAMFDLVESLNISGCTITTDALGANKDLCAKIVAKDADYVISLKKNHRDLYKVVSEAFEQTLPKAEFREQNIHHGRQEERKCHTLKAGILPSETKNQWPGLAAIVRVTYSRTEVDPSTAAKAQFKTSHQVRYYLSSRTLTPKKAFSIIRSHWAIENKLHWALDVGFGEDGCQIRERVAAENFSILRRIALSLLNQEKTTKRSLRRKRLVAAWNRDYLSTVLLNPAAQI